MVLESEFPVARGGGSEIQLRTLGEALRRRGHRVTVLAPRLALGPQATTGRHFGLAVARLKYPRIRLLGGVLMLAKLAAFLRARGHRYDVVHVHIAHHLALVCCAVAPTVGLRTVVKVSGWWELGRGLMRDGAPLTALLRPVWRRADAWQAVSRRIGDALTGMGIARDRVHAIPNAIDLARFPMRNRVRAAGTPRMLVFVGRLAPEKDLRNLVRAWAQAFAGRSDRRLQLVGTGREMAALQKLAAKSGCADSIEFLGDPARATYAALGFERASFARVWLHPGVWRRYAALIARGRRLRPPGQDVYQLGGDAVVDAGGRLRRVFASAGPEDRPAVDELLAALH